MLSRRHIRVKVMQTVYAYRGGESDDFSNDEKFLLVSIANMYNLYLLLLSLLIELQKKAEDYSVKVQNKHLASQDDKNPNKKFIENKLLLKLKQNSELQEAFKSAKINNWDLDSEYVDILFKEIISSQLYSDHMETRTSDFKEDVNFIIDVYKEIIAPNEKLYDYLEDKNLTWLDDLPTVNTSILKLLRKVKPNSNENHFLPELYKDEDDKDFAKNLLKKTILNKTSLNKIIGEKTQNWDADRIARLDSILLQMAICELQNFSSIPVKVTINEYLEIAKEYSTPKSNIFINGILDNLVKEFQEEGKLNKVGRGLM